MRGDALLINDLRRSGLLAGPGPTSAARSELGPEWAVRYTL
jgi:hypothetical protein